MKSILVTGLALLLFSGNLYSQEKSKTHKVGELFGGGIVCYVEKNGKHGLIASLNDICTDAPFVDLLSTNSASPKSGQVKEVPDPKVIKTKFRTTEIDGISNTRMIIKHGYNSGAAWSCDIYNVKNYYDWYLPSLMELKKLISAGQVIDLILNNDNDPNTIGLSYAYWSSTTCLPVFLGNCTWIYKDGFNKINMTDYMLNVRAMRKF